MALVLSGEIVENFDMNVKLFPYQEKFFLLQKDIKRQEDQFDTD